MEPGVRTDHGFAWVVTICAFLCNIVNSINYVCFGVFLTHIAEHYQVTLTLLGFLAAMRIGLTCLVCKSDNIIYLRDISVFCNLH